MTGWSRFVARFALALVATLLVANAASAAGRVVWTKKTIEERTSNKSWKLEVAIYLNRAPDIAHVPMKFEFTPVAYYERARVDDTANPDNKKGKLVERKVPLRHRQALIESVEVGFMDPGRGTTQKRTKFSFKVTRAHGFEAGEYKVQIRDGRNGSRLGAQTRLTFKGENEVIDRRTISFVPGESKKKKSQMKKVDKHGEIKDDEEEEEGSDEESGDEPVFKGADETGEGASDDEGGSDDLGMTDDADGPPEIKEKPGGCCGGSEKTTAGGGSALLLPIGLGLGFAVRRRRRRQQRSKSARA